MKSWDAYGRKGTDPAEIKGTTNFHYKTCQPEWTYQTDCPDKGVAYAGTGNSCTYAFSNPKLSEVFDKSDISNATGVNIQYTSINNCVADSAIKATYNITLLCDKSLDTPAL